MVYKIEILCEKINFIGKNTNEAEMDAAGATNKHPSLGAGHISRTQYYSNTGKKNSSPSQPRALSDRKVCDAHHKIPTGPQAPHPKIAAHKPEERDEQVDVQLVAIALPLLGLPIQPPQ